jgi:uncharacterized protein (DUF305 family)
MKRTLLVLVTAGLVSLTGCGSTGGVADAGAPLSPVPASAAASTEFNASDVMFQQMMIQHLDQGVEIVRLAKTRAVRQDVKVLAAAIEVTQVSEADTMKSRLTGWNQPVAADTNPDIHAQHGGARLISPDTIATLGRASGSEFERQFLTLLSGHQHNAVEMARTEITGGLNSQVKDLASRIVQSRTAEISEMLAFLGK